MQPDSGQNYWQPEDKGTSDSSGTEVVGPPPVTQKPSVSRQENLSQQLQAAHDSFEPVTWEASEYVHHERDGLWFVIFFTVTVLILSAAVLFQNYTFAALVVVMAVAIGVYTRRPPRVIHYTLTGQGLHISQQFHAFSEYRAFGILQDGALFSVVLLPTKRFAPATNVYFSENEGEKIVDILGSYLPMEEIHPDILDNLLRRLRL